MKLITEFTETLQVFSEANASGKKNLYVEGPYISVDVGNKNGRIYPRNIMQPVVESYIKDKIQAGTAYGEWGHPNGPKINEERISHRITNFRWDGNAVVGKALDEGMGKIMRSIIESGGRVGMSTRGMGSVKANAQGLQEVQDDFKLVTVDAVTDPSGAGCYVNGILESREFFYDSVKDAWTEQQIEDLQKEIKKKFTAREINENKLALFEFIISNVAQSRKS
jgi:hypothetical protein